jgi:hypothetical protein
MGLEAVNRWLAFVFDPPRIVIILARRGDDRCIDKGASLHQNCLGFELTRDLLKQGFVQPMRNKRLSETDEGCALRRRLRS